MACGIWISIRENNSQSILPQETKDVTLPQFVSQKVDQPLKASLKAFVIFVVGQLGQC